jgi:hypothetical protein
VIQVSLALIGGLVGLAFAVAEYWVFGVLIARAGQRGERGGAPRAIDVARKAQLILFPLIGILVGSIVAGENGV